jgi:flagellar basal body-associated protein FliL
MSRTLIAIALAGLIVTTGAMASDAPKTDAGKGGTRLTSAPSYVPMPPLTSATPMGRSIGGMITAEFGLDIPDARLRTRAMSMRPRIMDALRSAVSDYSLSHYRAGGAPDPTQLTLMAQQGVDRAMGVRGVRVLIANVMVTDRR